MKIVIAALALLFSANAFGFVAAGSYQGKGKWKDIDGQTGTWKETHQVEQTDGGTVWTTKTDVLMNGEIVFSDEKTAKFVEKENGFFEISQDGQVVGKGYCFAKVCHYEAQFANEKVEETLTFTRQGFRKVGSTQGEMDGQPFYVSYKGRVKTGR